MEALAVAASIAGLLSLASQCVNGAEILKDLFAEAGAGSLTIDAFLQDINSLLRTLRDVEELLETVSNTTHNADSSLDVASLQIQLEDCLRDVSSWLKTAQDIRPSSRKGAKSWVRRFWIVANRDSMSSIRKEIGRRRIEISTSLLILSNTQELRGFRGIERVEKKVDEALSHSSNVGDVLQRLQTLDATAQTILTNSEGSMRSLQSICGSMSRFPGPENWNSITSETASGSNPDVSLSQQGYFRYQSGSPFPSPALSGRSSGGLEPIDESSLDLTNASSPPPNVLDNWLEPIGYPDQVHMPARALSFSIPSVPNWDSPHFISKSGRVHDIEKETDSHMSTIKRHKNNRVQDTSAQCAVCQEQFKTEIDVQKHQIIKHSQRFSWSCEILKEPEAAFYSNKGKLYCGYCGKLMSWQSQFIREEEIRYRHLLKDHRFGECNHQKKYADKQDFLLHLQNFHSAQISGKWIFVLENACVSEEPDSGEILFEAVNASVNRAAARLEKTWDFFKHPSGQHHFQRHTESSLVNNLLLGPYDDLGFTELVSKLRLAAVCTEEIHLLNLVLSNWPLKHGETMNSVAYSRLVQRKIDLKIMGEGILKNAITTRSDSPSTNEKDKNILREWEKTLRERLTDESPETSADVDIRTQSYNASLLSTWTGNRDRVNRWMLHALGSSADQANIHRSMMYDPDIPTQSWSRLVLKYWFLDDAALGIEFEPSPSVGAAHSPDASSLWSSMFETCKSHLEQALIREGDDKEVAGESTPAEEGHWTREVRPVSSTSSYQYD